MRSGSAPGNGDRHPPNRGREPVPVFRIRPFFAGPAVPRERPRNPRPNGIIIFYILSLTNTTLCDRLPPNHGAIMRAVAGEKGDVANPPFHGERSDCAAPLGEAGEHETSDLAAGQSSHLRSDRRWALGLFRRKTSDAERGLALFRRTASRSPGVGFVSQNAWEEV